MQVTVYVCTTCRSQSAEADDPAQRPGQRMFDALKKLANSAAPTCGAVRIEPVECLSVCKRPATVAVASSSRWTYIYGDLDPEKDAQDILDGATAYAQTGDGIVPWRERVVIFKRGVVARIPPFNESASQSAAARQTQPANEEQEEESPAS